ncbi:hypothetical protein [uncultured Tenacibaculum sp.]|uniref:hypothetical protein n=1 Tax=uncultured Tenacibaculum sp. TaxID=174713 RepID=UPI0026202942|nr:hypothetical protein [uncultured Tenacibaculum sp.]
MRKIKILLALALFFLLILYFFNLLDEKWNKVTYLLFAVIVVALGYINRKKINSDEKE